VICLKEQWKEQSERLEKLFAMKYRPVAVTFTNDPLDIGSQKKVPICRALKQATFASKSYVLDKDTSTCPGGSWHCGLAEPPSAGARRALQHFLTRGEKLSHSIVSFQRMQGLGSEPPTGLSDRIFIGPVSDAPLRPDIVVFVCTAEQACRLITLDHFWDGIPITAELTGSLCHAAIGYPVVTGKTNLTMGDWTARRMQKYPEDIVFLTIPYERIEGVVQAIPECSAGTAEVVIPENFREVSED
jgi:uncharacterized protein (DUF169 family)